LLVPAAYLDDATHTVSHVARLAEAAGVAPSRATLSVVPSGAAAAPDGPFLAIDVALKDEQAALAKISGDRLTLVDQSGHVYADVSGLTNLALIDLTHANGTAGIAYRTLGPTAPQLPPTLRLVRGDVALVASGGIARLFDSRHPGEVVTDRAVDDASTRRMPWLIAAGIVALLLALIAIAGIERRRHRAKGERQ
jgi:hypothetical protein